MIALFWVAVICLVVGFIFFFFACYFSQNSGEKVIKLSFDEFYKYYCLRPEMWYIDYYTTRRYSESYGRSYYECRIEFNSFLRYLIFVRGYNKGKHNKKNNNVELAFLEEIQGDIDRCRKEAENYTNKGKKILEELTK